MAERIANRYEVIDKLGEDLVSEEYRAHDQDGRTVAIKLLRPEACRRSAENLFRYRRVMRELSALRHPNLCEILKQGEWNDREYVALELHPGKTLSEQRDGPMDVQEAVRVVEAICRGLDAAHQKGILHGLLNPDSVLVDMKDGKSIARLREFGTGLLLDLTRIREKKDVRRIFGYLAPEQSGILRRPADARSDLYSMGILFYELLAGAAPYTSEEANVLISEHISRVPPSLRSLNSSVPEVIDKIVFKLIAKDPEDRYQTVAGVLADLEHFLTRQKDGSANDSFEIGLNDRLRKPTFSTRMIGREQELNRLQTALSEAKQERGGIVFIHGEPGIGKTRLINELRTDVLNMGGLFVAAKCSQYDAGTPFKVLSIAIESYVEKVRRLSAPEQAIHVARIGEAVGELSGEIVKLTPRIKDLIGEPPPLTALEPNQQRTRFMVTAVNFLAGLGKPEQPLTVFLDDLQWADEGSFELLERLAGKLKERGVLLLISYRDTEVGASHPLTRLQGILRQSGIAFEDIQVKPFELEQTREIVSRVLLEPPERVEALAKYLRGRAHGNPFFILELLRTMVEEGVLRYEDGHSHFDPGELEKVDLPDNIVEVVLRRMRDLPDSDLKVLSFAAIIGKQVELDLLSVLTQRQTEDLVSSIDRAIEHQVLERDFAEEQSVYFVHDRVQEAFYRRVQDVDVLHRQIAEALEARHSDRSGPIVYDLAYHFMQGKVDEKALSYSLKAAEMAAQSSAHDLAIDLYEKSRKILESQKNTDDPRYMDLLEELGEAYRVSGHFEEAIKCLRSSEELVRRNHADDSLRIARVLAKIGDAYFENGEGEKSAAVIEKGLKGLGVSFPRSRALMLMATGWEFSKHLVHMIRPKWLSKYFPKMGDRETVVRRLISRLSYIYYFNDLDRSFYLWLYNINRCENRAPSRMLAYQCALGGPIWNCVAWFWAARRDLNRCLELARQFGDTLQEARAYTYLGFTTLLYNPRESFEYSSKAIRMLQTLGEFWDLGAANAFRVIANSMLTPCKQAIEETEEFIAMARDAHLTQALCWALNYNAYMKSIQGEFTEETVHILEEAIHCGNQCNDRPDVLNGMSFLAFGYLRQKNYAMALSAAADLEAIMPTHEMKAAWIKPAWSICAQVYLEAVQNMPNLPKETAAEYMKKARYFCKESMSRGRKFPSFFGWACEVNGTYWWMKGKHKRARRHWDRGIRFMRQNESPFRLACILREAARWFLKENPSDRQAQEYLMEAKDLFARHDCFKDAAATAAMLQKSAPRDVHRTREVLTFKRHLESLLSVTQAIGSVFAIEDLLQQIVTYAMEVTGAERGCILFHSEVTKHLELRVGRGWSREVSEKPFSYESYGISLALVEQVQQRAESRIASAKDQGEIGSELGLYGVRQAMVVPLRTKEKDVGILYLDNHLADGVFGSEELELMKSFAVQATVSIENTRLVQSLVEQDRLKQEMRLGQEIQQGFLPKEAPKVSGLRLSATMSPAREIGGDYYDFILRPVKDGPSRLAIVIGDVTGKGLGAGLNMAMVKTTLLTLSRESLGLKEILTKANRILHGQMSFGTFISLLYLQWDPANRAMLCAGAGHCDILVYRKAGPPVELVHCGGTVLGLVPDISLKLEERTLALAPGDKVVLFTDGVVEALNADQEEFGQERLTASLECNGDLAPEKLVEAIRHDVEKFMVGTPQYDDITLIAIEIE